MSHIKDFGKGCEEVVDDAVSCNLILGDSKKF